MRVAATWLASISLFGSMVSNGESPDRILTKIPVEFQGRWLTSSDQCQSGYEGWLYVSNFQIQEAQGTGNVISVRHITTLEIEIDMQWRPTPKLLEVGRRVSRLLLSQDGRQLIETRDGNAVSRVRCE
jgi:hypothetical protein